MKSIKLLREKLGIKQDEIAEVFNVSQPTIAIWESDDNFPPAKRLPEIAKFFNCTIDELFKSK